MNPMNIVRRVLARLNALVATGSLSRFKGLVEAVDEFFLGTDKTARHAPFLYDGMDVKRMMSLVVIALLPAAVSGVYFYGWRVVAMIVVSYATGLSIEAVFSIVRRKPFHEGFFVTGMLFPLILPPTIPLWIVAVGVAFGVVFGKEVFGGTGHNIFNPALVGRLFISLAFPTYFTTMWGKLHWGGAGGFVRWTVDAVTQATPLIDFKGAHIIDVGPLDLFLGHAPGCVGETFRLGIIAGGLFLLFTRAADWRVPLSYLGSVALTSLGLNLVMPARVAPPWFQLLSGGLLFGAFFMANDPVTSPYTFTGRWIYGIALGVLTVVIRALSGLPESVMFAILLMNAVGPLIDGMVVDWYYRAPGTKVRRHAA